MSLKFPPSAKSRKAAEKEQQRLNALANKQLMLQELTGMEAKAVLVFQGLGYLLPNETLEDMADWQVEEVLQDMDRWKGIINEKVSDGGPAASDCNRDANPPFAAPSC